MKFITRYIIFSVFIVIGLSLQAQYKSPVILNDPEYDVGKRLRFGFSLGINTMDFTVRNSGLDTMFVDLTHLIPGFNVNAVSDFRLTENFHLRFLPGYAFGQRNLNMFDKNNLLKYTLKIESSFIDLPLGIKYCAQRTNNVRPYLLGGTNFRIDLAASKKITNPTDDTQDWYRLQRGNFYWEIGFGVDFFLTYFKFSTEFKWSVGFGNIIKSEGECPPELKDVFKNMNSQLFILAFHFE